MNKTFKIFGFLLGIFLITFPLYGENQMKGPWLSPKKIAQDPYPTSTSQVVFGSLIKFYSNVISPADGPRSPSYPTGSAYGRQAIEKYGFFGIVLIADRLIHEAEEYQGPFIMKYGVKRYYDPLEANTFWWDWPDKNASNAKTQK